jgi:hypothetical protein
MLRSIVILGVVTLQVAGCCTYGGGGGGLPPCLPSCNPSDCIIVNRALPGVMATPDTAVDEVPLPSAIAKPR